MVRREPFTTMASTSGTYTTPSGDPLISASRTTSPPHDMDVASTGRRSSGGLDTSGFSQYMGDNASQMNLSAGSLGGVIDFGDFGDVGQSSQLNTPHGSRAHTPTSNS